MLRSLRTGEKACSDHSRMVLGCRWTTLTKGVLVTIQSAKTRSAKTSKPELSNTMSARPSLSLLKYSQSRAESFLMRLLILDDVLPDCSLMLIKSSQDMSDFLPSRRLKHGCTVNIHVLVRERGQQTQISRICPHCTLPV